MESKKIDSSKYGSPAVKNHQEDDCIREKSPKERQKKKGTRATVLNDRIVQKINNLREEAEILRFNPIKTKEEILLDIDSVFNPLINEYNRIIEKKKDDLRNKMIELFESKTKTKANSCSVCLLTEFETDVVRVRYFPYAKHEIASLPPLAMQGVHGEDGIYRNQRARRILSDDRMPSVQGIHFENRTREGESNPLHIGKQQRHHVYTLYSFSHGTTNESRRAFCGLRYKRLLYRLFCRRCLGPIHDTESHYQNHCHHGGCHSSPSIRDFFYLQ